MSYDKAMEELRQMGVEPPSFYTEGPIDRDSEIIENMSKVTGVNYSDEQINILKHRGNMRILACAGSGKTTVLTHLLAKRILSGEIQDVDKMICTTYSKSGATEIEERLNKLLKSLGVNKQVKIKTLHAFFYELIRIFGLSNFKVIDNSQRLKYIREACKEADFRYKDDELMLVDQLLGFQVNNLMSDKEVLGCYVNTLESLTESQYRIIRKSYERMKLENGYLDFDDMQLNLYAWLCKYPNAKDENTRNTGIAVRDYCRAMWTDFYIDEAQDVSKIQFEIIKEMIIDDNKDNKIEKGLVFVGDDDQSIYKWRGAEPEIILTIGAKFDLDTFVLSTNYRCLNEIVDFAATGIKLNKHRHDKNMTAYNDGGKVSIATSELHDILSLSKVAYNKIDKLIKSGEKLENIAVLCRNNFHVSILSNMLMRNGIYSDIQPDMRITSSSMYRDIKTLIQICDTENPSYNHRVTSDILWKLCKFMGRSTAYAIAKFQEDSSLSIQDTLAYLIYRFSPSEGISLDRKVNVPEKVVQRIQYHWYKMNYETIDDIVQLYRILTEELDEKNRVKGVCMQYLMSADFLYKSKDKARTIQGLTSYFVGMVQQSGIEKTLEFLRLTEQMESGNMGILDSKITLSTIHGAKGREWKNVILFACDNISMPSIDGIYKLINDGVPVKDINNHIDEERRLFYVACTRAKEDLTIVTYKDKPGVFILEALGLFNQKNKSNNDTIIQLVYNNQDYTQYEDFIDKSILNVNSKYYYNE